MPKKLEIQWLKEPEEHNYPAAESYLSLHYDQSTAKSLAEKLKAAPLAQFKAKDIFRASGLSLLGVSNAHVEKDQKKIAHHSFRKTRKLLHRLFLPKLYIRYSYHACQQHNVLQKSIRQI